MNIFSRSLATLVLTSCFVLPYLASNQGWGIKSEQDKEIIKASAVDCPVVDRDAYGRCRHGHRSYFRNRSMMGGGPSWGK